MFTTVVVLLLMLSSAHCFRKCDQMVTKKDLNSGLIKIAEKPVASDEHDEENFKVDVSNTGPAVIWSEIDFLAELSAESVVINKKEFLYHWMNDADYTDILETTDNYRSNISSYMFDSELILPNKYQMKVCVYRQHKENIRVYRKIAENHTIFELTASLNGKAHIFQNVTHVNTTQGIFSTKRIIQHSVNLTDKFSSAHTYWFEWFIDGQRVETKENVNFFEFIHNRTGMCNIRVQVTMDLVDAQKKLKGTWSKSIYLEDEIQYVNILSSSETIIGEPIKLNITFDGSEVIVCWRILDLNNSTVHNRSCDEPKSRGWFLTPGIVLSPGQYIAEVTVTNDVSSISRQSQVMSVYNGGTGSSSPLAVPVIFSMLGLIVIIAAAAYFVRLKKKRDVEVADFDFHPEIQSTGSRIFNKIKGSVTDFFQRNDYLNRHRLARYHQTSAKSYGSLEDSNEHL
ncbi:uncharacterized protein LOC133199524 [Saccostrea echinata]|uniref:uncharacterized protein LOC133199524 n=1 Tax=Saccostrea echinata TaxID=191078 RepID=UPI002A82198C|nr:uncharacterized protein LOC133199524 [Saccostrea echinata]